MVDVMIDVEFGKYVNGFFDRGYFDVVQVVLVLLVEVLDEVSGVCVVILGVKYLYNGCDGLEVLFEVKDIFI